MLNDALVHVDQLSILDAELLRRARDIGLAIDVTPDATGLALSRALMFERWPELLPTGTLDPQRAFYNRYFWFRRFATLWQDTHGGDAGIEQQALQILEHVDFDVDWALWEEVDRAARDV